MRIERSKDLRSDCCIWLYDDELGTGWWGYKFQMVVTKKPLGDLTEWRVYNPSTSNYIVYNGGRDKERFAFADSAFDAWYRAPREMRKEYFRHSPKMEPIMIDERCSLVCCGTASLASVPCQPTSNWIDPYIDLYDLYCNPPLVEKEEKENVMISMNTTSSKMPTVTDLTINMAPAASASVSAKSDIQIQREHLLTRLRGVEENFRWGRKSDDLREAFNLDADNEPKTSRELIDMIKTGKFKLDDRIADLQDKGNSYDPVDDRYIENRPFAAIKFDGPTPDHTGYTKARETIDALLKDAKDTIIVKSPEDGLAAIQAIEAWTPTGKSN